MDSKYYTPSIDEFYVGFEYEEKVFGEWLKTFPFPNGVGEHAIDNIDYSIKIGDIRVKYLDKEDIESCGFKAELNGYQEMSADSQWHADLIKEDGTTIIIHFWTYDYDNNINPKIDSPLTIFKNNITRYNWKDRCWCNEPKIDLVFNGKIKNISELRKLLKQLGIDGNN